MDALVEFPDSQYLWLLVPQLLLLLWSYGLFQRKGWRGLFGAVAALLCMFGFIVHFVLIAILTIHESEIWVDMGELLYSLSFNLYQTLPLSFLTMLLFTYDEKVMKECHRLRGLSNPNMLRPHKGRLGIGMAILLFVLPGSLVTAPLGFLWQHGKYHGMLRGEVEPRGKGLIVVGMAIFAGTAIVACTAAAIAMTAVQFVIIENASYFPLISEHPWLAYMGWVVVAGPFALLLIGGFIQQYRYGSIRCVVGVAAVLVVVSGHASAAFIDAPLIIKSSWFETIGWFGLVIATCLPQRVVE